MNSRVRKIVTLSLFLALGVVLSYFESWIPLPIPVPGIRLGLANIFGLVTLYFYSEKEYFGIGALRVLIVGLIRGSLINLAISSCGFIFASTSVVLIRFLLKNKVSIYGLSIISAFMHSIGQIIVVIALYNLPGMINYLPIIMISSIISSIVVALLASILISRVNKVIIKGGLYE